MSEESAGDWSRPTSGTPPHPFSRPFDARDFESRLRALPSREPYVLPRDAVPADFKRSSVLICFWREAEDLRVLFTKRAESLRGHPGQMSFPGGKLEVGESWVAAALRETEEEVGIPREHIEVLGRLDDAWSGAGHVLVPIVGWLDGAPDCSPNPHEVAEIHTPSVADLFRPDVYQREEANLGGDLYYNSIFHWQGGRVFGLSTDLLIEAVQWGIGISGAHGPGRLESLRSYVRYKSEQATD